jgi:hypothetical protein
MMYKLLSAFAFSLLLGVAWSDDTCAGDAASGPQCAEKPAEAVDDATTKAMEQLIAHFGSREVAEAKLAEFKRIQAESDKSGAVVVDEDAGATDEAIDAQVQQIKKDFGQGEAIVKKLMEVTGSKRAALAKFKAMKKVGGKGA